MCIICKLRVIAHGSGSDSMYVLPVYVFRDVLIVCVLSNVLPVCVNSNVLPVFVFSYV